MTLYLTLGLTLELTLGLTLELTFGENRATQVRQGRRGRPYFGQRTKVTGIMANSPSARKRIRQTIKRTARQGARRSRARRFVRFCEEALAKYALGTPSAKEAAKATKNKQTGKSPSKSADKGADSGAPEAVSLSLDEHFRRATSELHRAAQKGALHRKAVSRKVSRLAKRMKALTQGEDGAAASGAGKGTGKGASSK